METVITGMMLIDEGTLDTVIAVSGSKGSRTFRYNIEQEESETRENIIAVCKALAEQDYFDAE